MKIACIQMDMLFAQPEENFAKAKRLIREAMASGPDVVVLPETWNTGFFPKERLSELAERDCARVKRELGGLAAELGVNLVAGSVANVRGGKVYNTACVFDRASGGTEFLFDTFIGKEFHGTGDVFASVLTGALVKGKTLHEAVRLAEAFVRECAIQTMPQNIPAREGVDFEPILWKLHEGL